MVLLSSLDSRRRLSFGADKRRYLRRVDVVSASQPSQRVVVYLYHVTKRVCNWTSSLNLLLAQRVRAASLHASRFP